MKYNLNGIEALSIVPEIYSVCGHYTKMQVSTPFPWWCVFAVTSKLKNCIFFVAQHRRVGWWFLIKNIPPSRPVPLRVAKYFRAKFQWAATLQPCSSPTILNDHLLHFCCMYRLFYIDSSILQRELADVRKQSFAHKNANHLAKVRQVRRWWKFQLWILSCVPSEKF